MDGGVSWAGQHEPNAYTLSARSFDIVTTGLSRCSMLTRGVVNSAVNLGKPALSMDYRVKPGNDEIGGYARTASVNLYQPLILRAPAACWDP
jgi:hypothetical protein